MFTTIKAICLIPLICCMNVQLLHTQQRISLSGWPLLTFINDSQIWESVEQATYGDPPDPFMSSPNKKIAVCE